MGCGHRAPAGFARIRSHQAFAAAGADVLYAPGIGDLATIEAVVSAVSKPVNVVMTNADPSITAETPASVGVKLISVGGSIARYAMAAFLAAVREMKDKGTFTFVPEGAPSRQFLAAFAETKC